MSTRELTLIGEEDAPDLSQEISDKLSVMIDGVGELTEAVRAVKPVVNVAAPIVNNTLPAADVQVAAPNVTFQHARKWRFEITERDSYGCIKSFTATPSD